MVCVFCNLQFYIALPVCSDNMFYLLYMVICVSSYIIYFLHIGIGLLTFSDNDIFKSYQLVIQMLLLPHLLVSLSIKNVFHIT